MANSYFLTQYRVDSASGLTKDSPEPEHKQITEPEFTALLRQHWPATREPENFSDDCWRYRLRSHENAMEHGELNLLRNMISERHLGEGRWTLLAIIFQRYVQQPVYMWNDSDLDDFLEITDSTTERDILLWLDSR